MAAIYRGTSRRFSVRILAGGEIGRDGAPALVELWWPIVKGEATGGVRGEESTTLAYEGRERANWKLLGFLEEAG